MRNFSLNACLETEEGSLYDKKAFSKLCPVMDRLTDWVFFFSFALCMKNSKLILDFSILDKKKKKKRLGLVQYTVVWYSSVLPLVRYVPRRCISCRCLLLCLSYRAEPAAHAAINHEHLQLRPRPVQVIIQSNLNIWSYTILHRVHIYLCLCVKLLKVSWSFWRYLAV